VDPRPNSHNLFPAIGVPNLASVVKVLWPLVFVFIMTWSFRLAHRFWRDARDVDVGTMLVKISKDFRSVPVHDGLDVVYTSAEKTDIVRDGGIGFPTKINIEQRKNP
jgi:hypothetical protein